jgi:hypothetical protein
MLAAKVTAMEAAFMAGEDVSVIDLARLSDQVNGRAPAEDRAEYDLSRLTDSEAATLNALCDKARRR